MNGEGITPIFYTKNQDWCKSAPLGWTYVLVNDDGLVKIGKTENKSVSRRVIEDRNVRGSYHDFRFFLALSGCSLEPILHRCFESERLCYLPRNGRGVADGPYMTSNEVRAVLQNDPSKEFRKTNKELFKFESSDLLGLLFVSLKNLGYLLVEMAEPDDVLPYDSVFTTEILAEMVANRALRLANGM